MAKPIYDVYNASCPTRQALDRIAGKWTVLIVGLLAERPHRFGELKARVDGISNKVLTETLKGLVEDGLVHRRQLSTNPVQVQYSLTPLGQSLAEPVRAIREWAERHVEDLKSHRQVEQATSSRVSSS